jgi:hypothetical protein
MMLVFSPFFIIFTAGAESNVFMMQVRKDSISVNMVIMELSK